MMCVGDLFDSVWGVWALGSGPHARHSPRLPAAPSPAETAPKMLLTTNYPDNNSGLRARAEHAGMGIHCDTTLYAGPPAVVAGKWRENINGARDEARDLFGSAEESGEEHEGEDEEVDIELTAYQQWQAEKQGDIKDTRPLRPHAAACRSWTGRIGSCFYDQNCHFRHDTAAFDRPEFEEWRARNPGGPESKLTRGPSGNFKLGMQEPNRTTDDLYDEMAADPIMRTALGLGLGGPEGLDYCPGPAEKLSAGVMRFGYDFEEMTVCWWRVTNPAALLGGGAAGAPIDGRRELLGTMAKELTAARHQLQSLAVALPETQLYKATNGVSSALRVVEAAKAAPTANASAPASTATTAPIASTAATASTASTASASADSAPAGIDPKSGLPFYVVGGKSTWDHPTRPVVASVLTAISAVGSLKQHEIALHNDAEPDSDDDEDYDEAEHAYCQLGSKRRRSSYDYYDDFDRGQSNGSEATLTAACRAESHLLKIAEMLRLPPAERPVPQFMYTPQYMQPYPLPTSDATDDAILTAASSDAHKADLRLFLRYAAAKGHEVLIHHNVG